MREPDIEARVFHRMAIRTLPSGRVEIHHETNDDNDDGYDDGYLVEWTNNVADVETALRITGKSRTGISGVRVTVSLDGVEVQS